MLGETVEGEKGGGAEGAGERGVGGMCAGEVGAQRRFLPVGRSAHRTLHCSTLRDAQINFSKRNKNTLFWSPNAQSLLNLERQLKT
jgi:hypothetical protein